MDFLEIEYKTCDYRNEIVNTTVMINLRHIMTIDYSKKELRMLNGWSYELVDDSYRILLDHIHIL